LTTLIAFWWWEYHCTSSYIRNYTYCIL